MKYSSVPKLNIKVAKIIKLISKLATKDKYRAAFVFGSVARSEFGEDSDIDVKVIIKGETHQVVNHPTINGVKLDISFHNLDSFEKDTRFEISKKQRIPMIAESIIIFDKDGDLHRIREMSLNIHPERLNSEELNWERFMLQNIKKKAEKAMVIDPLQSLLIMNTDLLEIIKIHYKLNRKWQVSNKRIFSDLNKWDKTFLELIKNYFNCVDVKRKYVAWEGLLVYVLQKTGSVLDISSTNCTCQLCINNLTELCETQ